MPGNLAAAGPVGVLPKSLCTAFVETHVFPMLVQRYHDGWIERSLIEDGINPPTPIRTWHLARKLNETEAAALLAFFEGRLGGLVPFYFYDPYGALPGAPIGSNWDSTGTVPEGRHIVVFRGDWSSVTDISRSEVSLELMEVA